MQTDIRVVCLDFEAQDKKTLKGLAHLQLQLGDRLALKISNCMLHVTGDARWVSFPALQFGGGSFANVLQWVGDGAKEWFREAALNAIDAYRFGKGANRA